jgi:hypothetical protein
MRSINSLSLRALLIGVAFSCLSTASFASIAVSLAGLPIDSPIPEFTDPGSGVFFSNPSTPAGGDFFLVDSWPSTATLPDLTPGVVLSSNGYAPGLVSLPFEFSFTMTLPTLANSVDAILAYGNDPGTQGTMLMQGFDESGHEVASTSVQPKGSFFEQPLSLSSSDYNIKTVTFTPTNLSDAIGQITFTAVPEPSTLALLCLGGLGLLMRRR